MVMMKWKWFFNHQNISGWSRYTDATGDLWFSRDEPRHEFIYFLFYSHVAEWRCLKFDDILEIQACVCVNLQARNKKI